MKAQRIERVQAPVSWWLSADRVGFTQRAEQERERQNVPSSTKLYVRDFGPMSGKLRPSRKGPL